MAGGNPVAPDRNLALELVRVTESAALGAGRWIGRGDKISADQAAVDGMRHMLGTTNMSGVVVIGEGEKDEAPMLFNGEAVGGGGGPEVDVAVDPLEGTRLTALGIPGAISVMAVAERGTMFFPGAAIATFDTADDAQKALKEGAIDLVFGDGIGLTFWINGITSDGCCEFRGGPYLDPKYFGEGVGIAVKKGNRQLVDILNYALEQVHASGRYEELFLRYFPMSFF